MANGKTYSIGKKTAKIKWTTHKDDYNTLYNDVYLYYKGVRHNPFKNYKIKPLKTHPNDKLKIVKFFANKKVKLEINEGREFYAKTNSRGLLVLTPPEKTGNYKYFVFASKGWYEFKIKVQHSVSIPKVTLKKSAKKVVVPLQLKKIDGIFRKNQKITFKLDNKTYNVKTNKYGIAKVTIKKPVLNTQKVGQKVILQATYKNDSSKTKIKVKK